MCRTRTAFDGGGIRISLIERAGISGFLFRLRRLEVDWSSVRGTSTIISRELVGRGIELGKRASGSAGIFGFLMFHPSHLQVRCDVVGETQRRFGVVGEMRRWRWRLDVVGETWSWRATSTTKDIDSSIRIHWILILLSMSFVTSRPLEEFQLSGRPGL